MKLLGIDPGSRITGWGIIEADGWTLRHIAHGAIRCATAHGGKDSLPQRLLTLAEGLDAVLAEHAPEAAAVESVFSAKHPRSALILGHARGVVLLSLARAGLRIAEYSPMQVKSAVAGHGRADKKQVQATVATQLLLRKVPTPEDAADALAVAVCHSATIRFEARLDACKDAQR